MFNRKEETPKKTLLEKMQESKDKHGIEYICVYNDREVHIENTYRTSLIKYANDDDAFDNIGNVMYEVNEEYAREYDFDTLNLKLSLGLVFGGQDIDNNKKVKTDAKPLEGIVHYFTGTAHCYLDGEKTNKIEWGHVKSKLGYINYDILVKSAEENGLIFNGPKTFAEFKEHILVGEPFEISLTASLNSKENVSEKQPVKIK